MHGKPRLCYACPYLQLNSSMCSLLVAIMYPAILLLIAHALLHIHYRYCTLDLLSGTGSESSASLSELFHPVRRCHQSIWTVWLNS